MTGSPPGSVPEDGPDLLAVAGLLQRYDVDCILVGGMSAMLHGSTVHTSDIDTVPLWTRSNLERLCRALNSVDAQIMTRPSPDGDPDHEEYRRLPGGLDADDIRHVGSFRVRTAAGDRIDVLQSIPLEAGEGGHRAKYAELAEAATPTRVADDVEVQLVSRDHLIRSKSAIGRPHDIAVVRELTSREARRPVEHPDPPRSGSVGPVGHRGGPTSSLDPDGRPGT